MSTTSPFTWSPELTQFSRDWRDYSPMPSSFSIPTQLTSLWWRQTPRTLAWGQSSPSVIQLHTSFILVPFSLNASPAERNHDVESWELLAVVLPLREWWHRLEGTLVPFLIWTNHKNLSYRRSARRLNSCLAHWTLSVSCFNYTLYRLGSRNGKPDAPSTSSPQLTPSPSCPSPGSLELLRPVKFCGGLLCFGVWSVLLCLQMCSERRIFPLSKLLMHCWKSSRLHATCYMILSVQRGI